MDVSVTLHEAEKNNYVKVSGELDAYTAPKLREKLMPLTEQENVNITIDLNEVNYMDSTGLGVFVGLLKSVKKNNGNLKLVNLSDRLQRLFSITGLSEIMDINSDSKVEGGIK